MDISTAIELLQLGANFSKKDIQKAYFAKANQAEDQIDAAADAAAEDAAWQLLQQVQQARALLLAELASVPTAAAPTPQPEPEPEPANEETASSGQIEPLAKQKPQQAAQNKFSSMDEKGAYALLMLNQTSDLGAINRAFEQQMAIIEQGTANLAPAKLWNLRQKLQQAHYLLQQKVQTENIEKQRQQALSRRAIRALSILDLEPPFSIEQLFARYHLLADELEHQLDAAKYASEVDAISERQRIIQRAFSHGRSGLIEAGIASDALPTKKTSAKLDKEAQNQAPSIVKPLSGMLLLVGLVMIWWLYAPPVASPEQKQAAQLQQQTAQIYRQMQTIQQQITDTTLAKALQDSDDYPKWQAKRNSADELMHSATVKKLKQAIAKANQSFKQARYRQALDEFEQLDTALKQQHQQLLAIGND